MKDRIDRMVFSGTGVKGGGIKLRRIVINVFDYDLNLKTIEKY